MKLDKIQVVSIIVSIISSGVSYRYYKKAEQINSLVNETVAKTNELYSENRLLNNRVTELDANIKFVEQITPEIQKRNSKAAVIKEIVLSAIKNTKENNFKSDREFNDYIFSVIEYSEKFRIPISLILAISRAESNFNPRAVSPTKAQGIMQMIPSTTKTCLLALDKEDHDSFYVRDATACGVWYLRQLKNIFKDDDELVIKSYNVGPTYIINYHGTNLPEETINYHEKVTHFLAQYKAKIYWEH